MFLFKSYNKEREVQKQLVRVINALGSPLNQFRDGPRIEGRINLTIAVQVVPWTARTPSIELAIAATTRELSTAGLSIVVDQPLKCEKCAIGWIYEGEMQFARGKCRHQDPIGAGFWNVGVRLEEILPRESFPELYELRV